MFSTLDVGLSSNTNNVNNDLVRSNIAGSASTHIPNEPVQLAGLQNSLSSMDLNIDEDLNQQQQQNHHPPPPTPPNIGARIQRASTDRSKAMSPVAASEVANYRRSLRQRPDRVPATNRRTISRPRKYAGATSSNIFAYPFPSPFTMSVEDALNTATPEQRAQLAAAELAQRRPTDFEIAQFYTNANKSARVKSTCLETIQECSDEDTTTAADGCGQLAHHVNFLSVRKLKRSLSFASASANNSHRPNNTLQLRRRRRIKEKLGAGARKLTKFSMKVFMDKMHALHEAEEMEEVTQTAATADPGQSR